MRPHKFDYSPLSCQEDDARFLPSEAYAVGDARIGLDGQMKKISSLGNMRGAFNPEGVRLPEKAPLPASRFYSIEKAADLGRNHPLVSESIFDNQYSKARRNHSEWNSYIPADRFAFSVAGERALLRRTRGLSDCVPVFSTGDYVTKSQPFDHVARVRDSSMAAMRRQSSGSSLLTDSPFSSDVPLSTLSHVGSTNVSDLGPFGTYSDPQEGGKGIKGGSGSFQQSWAQQTEETYNLQLALTLRLVTEAEITEEPILLPYHVSETQSVLLSAGSSSVQATSLRFWVNGSLGYADHIRDGFYHVWGMNPHVWALCSNRDEDGGRLPKLDLLKAVDPKLTMMEVVMIDKHTDAHLCELENQAINFSLAAAEPKELAEKLAKIVCESMGGSVTTELGELTSRWKASSIALKECLNCVVVPIGSISVGVCRHRALLFKVLADCVNLPCRIVHGCKYCGKDDGVSCLVLCGNEREFLVDLIAQPGVLCCPQAFLKSLQPSMITSPLRLPEWKSSEISDNEIMDWKNTVMCRKGSEIMNADNTSKVSSNAEKKECDHIARDSLDASAVKRACNKMESVSNANDLSNLKNLQANHDINDSISMQRQLRNMKITVAEENLPKTSDGSHIVNSSVHPLEDNMNITQQPLMQHPTDIHTNQTRLDLLKPSDITIRKPKNAEVLLALDGLEIAWEELTIKERVGAGSFGTVHRADWNGSEVAVKVFVEQDFVEERVDEFMREVAILKRTRHPNVVLFMGVVMKRPNFSIVTEYLPRGSLFRLLHRPGMRNQLDERRRIRMALDVARGMNYLHRLNPPIVHRDLKSPNLLVDKTWTVKVCDFGLSRLKMKTFLSSRSAAGTAEWMAPEVLRDEPSNEKSDVYSFGVILWELFTLQQPWSGLSPAQVVGAVGFQQRRPPIPKDVNPELAALIESCWANDSKQRPSFTSIMESLKSLQKVALADATKAPTS